MIFTFNVTISQIMEDQVSAIHCITFPCKKKNEYKVIFWFPKVKINKTILGVPDAQSKNPRKSNITITKLFIQPIS